MKMWQICFVIVCLGYTGLSSAHDAPWPGYGHDPQHTNRSAYRGPVAPKKLWSFPVERGRVMNFSPSINDDGTIYVGTWGDRRDGFLPGKLYAINSDGTQKWRFDPPEPEQHSAGDCCIWGTVEGSITIATDGTLYFGRGDNKLYALNPSDGSLKWQFRTFPEGLPELGGQVISSPILGPDGTIYFGTVPQFDTGIAALFAVNPDGSEKWRYEVGGDIFASPALGPDGTIYIGDRNGTFHAVVDQGSSYQIKWVFTPPDADWFGTASLGPDGTIYVPAADVTGFCRSFGRLYALTDAGSKAEAKWGFTAPFSDEAGIAEFHVSLGSDDTIFYSVASINNSQPLPCGSLIDQGGLFALTDNGPAVAPTVKWRYSSPWGGGVSGSVIDAAGTVYVVVRGEGRIGIPGQLDALDPESGASIWDAPFEAEGEIWWGTPAIGATGVLYFADAACTDILNVWPCDKIPALYAVGDHSVYLPLIVRSG